MRWLPKAIPVLIAIISLDFALVFGAEAVRVLSSPIYGLDQFAFASLVHGFGRLLAIRGEGLFSLAGFFGGLYLTISVVFTMHLASRIGALRGGQASHDLLDAGLILVVMVTLVAATPLIMKGATDILIQERLPLWLVGLAATLSMIERLTIEGLPETGAKARPGLIERLWARSAARRTRSRNSIVTPARRNSGASIRWDDLRNTGGLVIEPAAVARPARPWFALRTH
jgi:hypothetical protein